MWNLQKRNRSTCEKGTNDHPGIDQSHLTYFVTSHKMWALLDQSMLSSMNVQISSLCKIQHELEYTTLDYKIDKNPVTDPMMHASFHACTQGQALSISHVCLCLPAHVSQCTEASPVPAASLQIPTTSRSTAYSTKN